MVDVGIRASAFRLGAPTTPITITAMPDPTRTERLLRLSVWVIVLLLCLLVAGFRHGGAVVATVRITRRITARISVRITDRIGVLLVIGR